MKLSDIPPELIDEVLLKTDAVTFWTCQQTCKLFQVSSTKELHNRFISIKLIRFSEYIFDRFCELNKKYLNKTNIVKDIVDILKLIINKDLVFDKIWDWRYGGPNELREYIHPYTYNIGCILCADPSNAFKDECQFGYNLRHDRLGYPLIYTIVDFVRLIRLKNT